MLQPTTGRAHRLITGSSPYRLNQLNSTQLKKPPHGQADSRGNKNSYVREQFLLLVPLG